VAKFCSFADRECGYEQNTILNHMVIKKVVLYGSQVSGKADEKSDIDIAVIVDIIEEDFLEANAKLYKIRRSIDDRIEPILIEEGNDQSGFLKRL
jgi:predicted nucleotidyltransferase